MGRRAAGPAAAVLLAALLAPGGCAAPVVRVAPAPAETPSPPPPPPAPAEVPRERLFPEFAAVIAADGDTFDGLAERYLKDPSMGWFVARFNGLSRLSPGDAVVIPFEPYYRGGIGRDSYQVVPVLCYHKFSRGAADRMTVTEAEFEAQMRFLAERGYSVVSLDRLFDFLAFSRQLPPKSVVITIDDGWRSAYEIAYPILKRYGYPATLFVYTDFIGQGRNSLTWAMIAEMEAGGIDIQCHTKSHRNLARREGKESYAEYFKAVRRELLESAQLLANRLRKEIRYLAYPFGDTNGLVVAVARKAGYRGALTVERAATPSFAPRYRVGRAIVYGGYDLRDFERNLAVRADRALR